MYVCQVYSLVFDMISQANKRTNSWLSSGHTDDQLTNKAWNDTTIDGAE